MNVKDLEPHSHTWLLGPYFYQPHWMILIFKEIQLEAKQLHVKMINTSYMTFQIYGY